MQLDPVSFRIAQECSATIGNIFDRTDRDTPFGESAHDPVEIVDIDDQKPVAALGRESCPSGIECQLRAMVVPQAEKRELVLLPCARRKAERIAVEREHERKV